MASKRKKICRFFTFFMLLINLLPANATNFDCGGKPFHCVNSTHFMICVDLGAGVTKTVDDFVIQCPPSTSCHESNQFECEYRFPTTTELNDMNSPADESNIPKSTVKTLNDITNTLLPLDKSTRILNEYNNKYDISIHTDYVPEINTLRQNYFSDTSEKTNTNNKATIRNEHFDYLKTTSETQTYENIPSIKILNTIDFLRPLEASEDKKFFQDDSVLPFSTKTEQVIQEKSLTSSNVSEANKINNLDEIPLNTVTSSAKLFKSLLNSTNPEKESKSESSLTMEGVITTDVEMEVISSYANNASFKINNRTFTVDVEEQKAKGKENLSSPLSEIINKLQASRKPETNTIIPNLLINNTYTSAINNNNTLSSTVSITTAEGMIDALEKIETKAKVRNSMSLDSNIENYTTMESTFDNKLPFENLTTSSKITLSERTLQEIVTDITMPSSNANKVKQMLPDSTRLLEVIPTIINENYDYYDATESPVYQLTPESDVLDQTIQFNEEITLSPIEKYVSKGTTLVDFSAINEDTHKSRSNNTATTEYDYFSTLSSISTLDKVETSENEATTKFATASDIITSIDMNESELSFLQNENPTTFAPNTETSSNLFNSIPLGYTIPDTGNIATTETINKMEMVYNEENVISKNTRIVELLPPDENTPSVSPFTVVENSYLQQILQNEKISTTSSQGLFISKETPSSDFSGQDTNTIYPVPGFFYPATLAPTILTTENVVNTKEAIGGNIKEVIKDLNEREMFLEHYKDTTKLFLETENSITLDNDVSEKSVTTEMHSMSFYDIDYQPYKVMSTVELENTPQVSPSTVTENSYFDGEFNFKNLTTTDLKLVETVTQQNKNLTSYGELRTSPVPVDIYSNNPKTLYAMNESEFFLSRDNTKILSSPSTLASTISNLEYETNTKETIEDLTVNEKDLNEKKMSFLSLEERGTRKKKYSLELQNKVSDTENSVPVEMPLISVYDTEKSPYEITRPDALITSEVILPVEIYTKNPSTLYPMKKTELNVPKNNLTTPSLTPALGYNVSKLEPVTNRNVTTGGSIVIKKIINETEMFLPEYEQGTTLAPDVETTPKTFNLISLDNSASDAEKSGTTLVDLQSLYETDITVYEIKTTTELPRQQEIAPQVIPSIITENLLNGNIPSTKHSTTKSLLKLLKPVTQTIKINSKFPDVRNTSEINFPIENSTSNSNTYYPSDEIQFLVTDNYFTSPLPSSIASVVSIMENLTNRNEAIQSPTIIKKDSSEKEMNLLFNENTGIKTTVEGVFTQLQKSVPLHSSISNTEKSTLNDNLSKKANSIIESDILRGFESNFNVTEDYESLVNKQKKEKKITPSGKYEYSINTENIILNKDINVNTSVNPELLEEYLKTNNLNTNSSLVVQDQESFGISLKDVILTNTEKPTVVENNTIKLNISTIDSAHIYFNRAAEKASSTSHYSNTTFVNVQHKMAEEEVLQTDFDSLITENSIQNYITNHPNNLYYTNEIIVEPQTDGLNIASYGTEVTAENKFTLHNIGRLVLQNETTAIPNLRKGQNPSITEYTSFTPTLLSNRDEILPPQSQYTIEVASEKQNESASIYDYNNTNTNHKEMESVTSQNILNSSSTVDLYAMFRNGANNSLKAESFPDDNKILGTQGNIIKFNLTIDLKGTTTNSTEKELYNGAEENNSTSTLMPSTIDFINKQPAGRDQYVRSEIVAESKKIINNTDSQFNIGETEFLKKVSIMPLLPKDSILLRTTKNNNLTKDNNLSNTNLNKQSEERISNKRSVLINTEATAYDKQHKINNFSGNKTLLGKVLTPVDINHETTTNSQIDIGAVGVEHVVNNRKSIIDIQKVNFSSNNLQNSNYEADIKVTYKDEKIFDVQLTPTIKSFVTEIVKVETPSDKTKLRNTTSAGFTSADISPWNIALFTCRNLLRGKYPDKSDCRRFYICIGKVQPVYGECPANTVFSNIKKQCTKNLSHCNRNNQFHCIKEGRFSDVLRSNIYYICINISTRYLRFQFRCQNGYHLNKTSIRCVANEKFQSVVTSISIDNDSKKGSDQSTVEKKSKENKQEKDTIKHICTFEGKFPDAGDCRKYYVCSKNSKSVFRRRIKKCDSDEVFHREKKKCVDSESYECK